MKTIAIQLERGVVEGRVATGFEPVALAFADNFTNHQEVGAACALYYRGHPVVDIWGGLADVGSGSAWQEDTICLVFSAAKGPTATCIHQLAEAGRLDIDLPIAHYWPEFGCNGKESITTRLVLTHSAGLAAVDGDLTLEQVLAWEPVVAAIAAQAPNWEPGTQHGYHARSFGWILGELIRRITGESPGAYLARHIAAPLGLRYWVGLPESELACCATLVQPEGGSDAVAELLGADSLTARVMSGPSGLFGYNAMWNRPDVLAAEMPSSNGVGDARSLARLYSGLIAEVDGVRLLGQEQLAKACEQQVRGADAVIFHETCFGLGYGLQPTLAPGAGPNSFGHPGAGGALAFADPDAQLGFAYVMNAMHFNAEGDPRTIGLVRAAYECLEAI
ncbi:serine hydrolase domain-containing protein [Pseudohalioglobus lutimaris]|uniref:serine hydrolase domain-containing protein n=1 Tax=Pseudohalioglobus lutimaris TaxID=1737061 RepID=UPI0013FE358A|nr:serine hydrolase domain-containing protein [Pseudohalioglobus lutimaris]